MASLIPLTSIVSQSLGASTLSKKKLAGRLLKQASQKFGFNDPASVSPESPTLLVNLLNEYSGMKDFSGDANVLKSKEAVLGIVSGLRWVYRDSGHIDNWTIRVNEDGSKTAHGNPLIGNIHIKEFRNVHAKKLSAAGKVARSAPPLSAEHVIEHGKAFLIPKSRNVEDKVDIRDVMLHAFLLIAMNCGMRYDELSKVKMENFKCTKWGIEFGIGEKCKNSEGYRSYVVRRWPGDHFSKCILMDTFFALSFWALQRGDSPGLLFCNVLQNNAIHIAHHEPWARKQFVSFMQERFEKIGLGSANARAHTGHSPKRGGVQLLRFLGVKDANIMSWFGMTGNNAYLRYTEGYNDLSGTTCPDFSGTAYLAAHAKSRKELDDILDAEDVQCISDWLSAPVSLDD